MASFFDGSPAREPSTRIAFTANRLERRSEHRDADVVPTALADQTARLYLLRGDQILFRGGDPLFAWGDARSLGATSDEIILLGWHGDGPRLAAIVSPDSTADASITTTDLRSLAMAGEVSAEQLGELAQARALANWHVRHRFCSNCGAPTATANGGYRRDCPQCDTQHFPRTDAVVIMLAIDESGPEPRALLGRQRQFNPGMYSALAGFVEPGETIEDAVRRETLEESGVPIGRVRYHASQPWPFPASLMVGCYAEARATVIRRDEDELEDCRWFARSELGTMLSDTHEQGLRAPSTIAIARELIATWVAA